jgi:hypothetical protein
MVVRSGSGGLHVYWCADLPMDIATWQPLADALKRACEKHGLKADPVVTADAARILRIPGTLNYKTNPPVVVALEDPRAVRQYTVALFTGVLAQYMGTKQAKTVGGSATVGTAWSQNFTANIDEKSWPKIPIDQVALNCPMTEQTLANGGAGKSEPEWSQDIFLAAHTSDPVDAAHRLSKGHVDYDPADTDRKLAEKQRAIANGNLGWPACTSFRHAACQTCPLLALGKSPIMFGHRAATVVQPMQPAYQVDPLMPEHYWRNTNDHVMTTGTHGAFDVLGYPILDGGIDHATGELVLQTHVSGKDRWGSCNTSKQTAIAICESLHKGTRNGIIVRGDKKAAGGFIMAWMTHLQTTKKYIHASGFGWSGKNFVFGDEMFTPNGPESSYRGNTVDPNYQRVGELQPWLDALPLVQGNPVLEVVVASAFAAPLISLACDYSPTLSVYSHQSGYGKSTAMKIAQAVWGDPRTGMSMLDDTENSVNKKTTSLKHLPMYWDEMKTKDQIDKLVRVVFATAQGRSKARLNRDSNQMSIGSATTLLTVASNHGIASAVYRATEGTDAGGLRVFEIEVPPLVTTVTASVSETLIIKLNENYGCAGAVYADFIVRNRAAVEKILLTISDDLEQMFRFDARERFWKNTMVTLIAGASLANAAGLTKLDTNAIRACLYEALRDLRISLKGQSYTLAGPAAGESVLNEMMADIRSKNLIHTDVVPFPTMGKPVKATAKEFTDPSRVGDVWMQVGEQDGRILARVRPFNDWLVRHKYQPDQIIKLLKQDYVITTRKASVGAGVPFLDAVKGRADCYDMTPLVAPVVNRNPSYPSSSFGSLVS